MLLVFMYKRLFWFLKIQDRSELKYMKGFFFYFFFILRVGSKEYCNVILTDLLRTFILFLFCFGKSHLKRCYNMRFQIGNEIFCIEIEKKASQYLLVVGLNFYTTCLSKMFASFCHTLLVLVMLIAHLPCSNVICCTSTSLLTFTQQCHHNEQPIARHPFVCSFSFWF